MPPKRRRQRHCLNCGCLFLPDPRSRGRQRHCSAEDCQRKRRNADIRNWYRRNPDCLEYQRQLTRQWFKAHPHYSRRRRADNPCLLIQNRLKTRSRMRRIRGRRLFDKTNSIISQLNGNKQDTCFLTKGRRWLLLGLTKQTRLRFSKALWENRPPDLVALPALKSGYLLPVTAPGGP